MRPCASWLILAVSALLLCASARADRLILSDGRTLEGEIHHQDDSTVTIEIRRGGSVLLQRVARDQIRTWFKRSTEGEPYVTLPINGVIGQDITPEALRAGFGQARAAGAKFVILAINSPGGNVGAMAEMVDDILAESKQTQVIAYVKQAYSAAAVIAMACRQVYMTPDAAIGAVVPFRMTDNGPVEVDAKFRSALQAKIRATAAMAEHADLIIRGMSELDLEVFLTRENGKPVLLTSGEGKLIKARGTILSLTGPEAAECGLARLATSMGDLGMQVAGGSWHEVSRKPWNAVIDTVAVARQREQAEVARARRIAQREAAIKIITPECQSLIHRMTQLRSVYLARQIDLARIQEQFKAEVARIQEEYDRSMAVASDRNNSVAANQANWTRDAQLAELQRKFEALVAAPRSETNAIALEAAALDARLKDLLASVPAE